LFFSKCPIFFDIIAAPVQSKHAHQSAAEGNQRNKEILWRVCDQNLMLLHIWKFSVLKVITRDFTGADGGEEELPDKLEAVEYMNEKEAVVSCAAKLVAHDMVPKVYMFYLRKCRIIKAF